MAMPRSCQLPRVLLLFLLLANLKIAALGGGTDELIFNGFSGTDIELDGQASITNRVVRLTHGFSEMEGRAFYSNPLNFTDESSNNASAPSFATTFVFVIDSNAAGSMSAHGMAFVLSSSKELFRRRDSSPNQYLGLPGAHDARASNQEYFAVELDTVFNPELMDIDGNHVGIDVSSLVSVDSHTAGFYSDTSHQFETLELSSGNWMQVWVDYRSQGHQLNVTMAPWLMPKPQRPLLSTTVDLSPVLSSSVVYAGFSSATGPRSCSHSVLGWSFKLIGEAPPLDLDEIMQLIDGEAPPLGQAEFMHSPAPHKYINWSLVLPVAIIPPVALILLLVLFLVDVKWRSQRRAEAQEEWSVDKCGLPSFTYKDLLAATSGFSKRMLLGKGGFGRVYRGVLAVSKQNIAIKRVSPDSKQGMKEFMAEIAILGHLRHRNLVQLLGYCRHGQELLLVYECMPNGSLDRYLHDRDKQSTLDWARRFHIIKGVASALLYLHEDWEQVVIHRDIKASNVLLDDEMNGRLGDFGLARLHDHGADAHTTHVAGTWGYIAPELARLGKATKATDVYAFGVFMMEVACGRQPIEVQAHGDPVVLADWVLSTWRNGSIIDAMDERLERNHVAEEVELVLKLGLLCSHRVPKTRPCFRLVMQHLQRDVPLPNFSPSFFSVDASKDEGFIDEHLAPCPSVVATTVTSISGGR